jgi:hypothetical protein
MTRRIARNHGVIPHSKVDDFHYAVAHPLREFAGLRDFDKFKVACLQFFKKFPMAKNWLKAINHLSRVLYLQSPLISFSSVTGSAKILSLILTMSFVLRNLWYKLT